ncbi:histone-lysine N-methyltransferase 2D-like isoform X2 [Amphibalanus amphitrite]|uniref:histone-lysine N-methyltransferase 2D-like isoform X2 n=1 Tax=Amphibalanus amphitrite TaxID=1232801 RepID=UPI001C92B41F|nr:histone-lysine N-methyltransferase 2D-like isoform X2 [Amphibalanus amphitrite]
MASSESQARLTQTEPAKWIVVYKNGDQHFAGRRMVVKPREIKTFDSLLEEVTLKLSPSFGAVRNIFTPEGGTRVSSLTDLKPNGKYVASPNEPFRQLSRTRYGELPVQSTSTSHSHVSLQPVKDKQVGSTGGRRHHGVPSRYRDSGSDELTIHVFRNGDAFSAASAVRVDRLARTHWQQTLERLGERLRIGRGVHKLYNLKGQLVRDPSTDLEHNGLYVAAADNESFRLVNYGAAREPFRSVTRGDSRSTTPRLPCPHQRVAESAPTVCAADSSAPRCRRCASRTRSWRAATHSSGRSTARRATSRRRRRRSRRPPGSRQAYHSLHQPPHHRPHVQRQLPKPPPRRVEVAPIDVAPGEAPPPVESDGPFSSSSSNTDLDESPLMDVVYPELSHPEIQAPERPEPFFLHPLPESGEADSNGYRSWEPENIAQVMDSALTDGAEQWHDGEYEHEADVFIVTDSPASPAPSELAVSHSAPHLSRGPSRADSGNGTPSPSEPRPTRSHLHRPRGAGFYSPGYSPLPEPRRPGRAATPHTPSSSPVEASCQRAGRLAAGGGSPAVSRAASEPRLESALGRTESQPSVCEIVLVEDETGELRCVSVLSRAASFPELVSPRSPEFAPVELQHLVPWETLHAPVSRGESPVEVDGGATPVPADFEDGSVTPTAGVGDGSRSPTDSEHSLLLVGQESSSSQAVTEREATSPLKDCISPGRDVKSPHPPSTCEDVLPPCYEDHISPTPEHQPPSPTSRDSAKLTASCRQSPVTPELRRPLLSRPVLRDLELPHRDSQTSVGVQSNGSDAVPTVAQSLPGVGMERAYPNLSPKAASVDQMSNSKAMRTTHSQTDGPHRRSVGVRQGRPKRPAPRPPATSSLEVQLSETPEHASEHPISAKRTSDHDDLMPSLTRSAPEKNQELASSPKGTTSSHTPTEDVSDRSPLPSSPAAEGDPLPSPPPVSLEEGPAPRPLPSPRRRRSVSESSPLSWSGTAASSGWVWDEVPARPADRAALAARAPPSLQQVETQGPERTAAMAEEAAKTGTSDSRDEVIEEERDRSLGEEKDGEGSREVTSPPPEQPEQDELPSQPIWPPTRTNTPGQTDDSTPAPEESSHSPEEVPHAPEGVEQTLETNPETPVPRSATATLSRGDTEPAVTEAERAPEAGRAPEAVPADIGQKLDEIASLLRTLLLQNMSAGRAADGGGAAPSLGGLTEEQLRTLLQPVVDQQGTGDSPPHKPR